MISTESTDVMNSPTCETGDRQMVLSYLHGIAYQYLTRSISHAAAVHNHIDK